MDIIKELARFYNEEQLKHVINHLQRKIDKQNLDNRWKDALATLEDESRSRPPSKFKNKQRIRKETLTLNNPSHHGRYRQPQERNVTNFKEDDEWSVETFTDEQDASNCKEAQEEDKWPVERITNEQCRDIEVKLQELRKEVKVLEPTVKNKKFPVKKRYQEEWSIAGQWCAPCKSRSEEHHAHTICTECGMLSDKIRYPFVDKCACKDRNAGKFKNDNKFAKFKRKKMVNS
ncbi:17319_t:CDS:1 [Acaulospora colombiana]|uniref:17319_t:CDS:1 n=1 Tax=Acaulospora colombiana TaxID=27376 RepID=A0ACA9L6D4_9GLOM|nr:17319_t:CDS:1 [Acaulospora colombiana]